MGLESPDITVGMMMMLESSVQVTAGPAAMVNSERPFCNARV